MQDSFNMYCTVLVQLRALMLALYIPQIRTAVGSLWVLISDLRQY